MMAEDDMQVIDPAAMISDLSCPSTVRPGSAGPSSNSSSNAANLPPGHSKYAQLLSVIEEMGRDIRPTYAGSRSSAERLKRGIVQARILVRECLIETERSARQ